MAIALLETFATDLLEHEHLLSLDIVGKNGSLYNGAFYIRSTNLNCTLILDEKYFVKLYGLVFLCCEPVDKNLGTSFYFELLSCNVYNCVHCTKNS